MKIFTRIFAAIFALIVCLWIWAEIMFVRQNAACAAYYNAEVQPRMEESKRQTEALIKAVEFQKHGKVVPLPEITQVNVSNELKEWAGMISKRNHYDDIKVSAFLAGLYSMLAWAIGAQIIAAVRRYRWEAGERPAEPGAGKLIHELMESGTTLVSKIEDGGVMDFEVQVDGRRRTVVFRNFAFISSFVGNPTLDYVEIPFGDIVGGHLIYDKGKATLVLRTTRGKVSIGDRLGDFKKLAALLLDVAELNRASPALYQAALAREPKVRTPWYGWLIIVLALVGVVVGFWLVFRD